MKIFSKTAFRVSFVATIVLFTIATAFALNTIDGPTTMDGPYSQGDTMDVYGQTDADVEVVELDLGFVFSADDPTTNFQVIGQANTWCTAGGPNGDGKFTFNTGMNVYYSSADTGTNGYYMIRAKYYDNDVDYTLLQTNYQQISVQGD